MTALLLKLEPLVVTERWEAHKVRLCENTKVQFAICDV